jgi:hypothetical protein
MRPDAQRAEEDPMSNEYPAERYARLRLTDPACHWRAGKVIPHKAPLENADPLGAYAPFLFDSLDAAEKAHAEDMVRLWELVADGDMNTADAYAVDDVMGIFRCTVESDGRLSVADPGCKAPTFSEQRARGDRRFGPDGEFEITREEIFAAYDVRDPLACGLTP